ncbi:LysR family transcriptional regulator [Mangrovicoccus algicola]|uniref:LysR family transcriptional regulator n=1 Tax=Mangrovicoccus algicola TaxID=2771008 RepID=A0A8J7CYP9_9RHOB|nr:LysR family transcriptional regulator [Mangrovicoccus algicola]MBE3639837.1 LysR family transcriptional regulator [Mangrovicoccus algicola]
MIDKLEMFLALVRERHFGHAAQRLGVTQPSLSAGIKQLEGQLGVQLVKRGARYHGLTPEGERVLIWARRMVGDARALKAEMQVRRKGLSGELRLAAIPTALPAAAALAARFGDAHPEVILTVLSQSSEDILAGLDNLETDLGITYLDGAMQGRRSVPLYDEDYCLVCPEDGPLAARARLGWAEVAAEPLCLLTPNMQNRHILNRNFAAAGRVPSGVLESNSTVVLMAQVVGRGLATILPRQLAEFIAGGKPVRIIPMEPPAETHRIGLLAPDRDPLPPLVEAFLRRAGGPG